MRESVYPKVCCHELCGQQKGEETRKCVMELRGNKMARTEECILYRNFDNGEVLDIMTSLMNSYEAGEEGFENRKEEFFHMAGSLVEMAGMYGFSGNLWHTYLTQLLVNHENAFSTASEIRGAVEGSINHWLLHDFGIFKELYDFDLA